DGTCEFCRQGRYKTGGTVSLTSLYLTSGTTPTIRTLIESGPWNDRNEPTALRARPNFLVNARFTTATRGAPRRSARVNSRPARRGTPRAAKWPAPSWLYHALRAT